MHAPHEEEPLDPGSVPLTAYGDVREKNQITIPKAVVEVLGLRSGDRLIFVVDEVDPTSFRAHRVQDSYAGSLSGVYGNAEGAESYLRGEREAWESEQTVT